MAEWGADAAGFSILFVVMLLYFLQSRLIRKVDIGNDAGSDAATARRVLRVVIAFCMSLVSGAYVAGVLMLIPFLQGQSGPKGQISGYMYPAWLIAVLTGTFVALTIANCWYAYHSRELITPGIETAKEH